MNRFTLVLRSVAAAVVIVFLAACNPLDLNSGKQSYTSKLYIRHADGVYCAAIGNADQQTDLELPAGYTVDASGVYDPSGTLLVAKGEQIFAAVTVSRTFSPCGSSAHYVASSVSKA